MHHLPDEGSTSDGMKQIFNQSEVPPRSGWWLVISMEFILRSFLRRHFKGKLAMASQMSAVFSGRHLYAQAAHPRNVSLGGLCCL